MNDEEMRNRLRPRGIDGVTAPQRESVAFPVTYQSTPSPAPSPAQPQAASPEPVMTNPEPAPALPAPEPVASLPMPTKHSHRKLILIVIAVVAFVGLSAGGYFMFVKKDSSDKKGVLGESTKDITIPLYYPKNLPDGYTFNNDAKTLKSNIFYFSVNGPNQQVFYITQQPLPASFDFQAFNKKFLKPDLFTTAAGTVTAGPVGANMIGSVRTDKNTWIIINSSSLSTLASLETVIRSLELTK